MAASPKILYGKQTNLAVQNFPISGETMPEEFLRALALIKEKAALVNGALGLIPRAHAQAIARAARRIINGAHGDQFPVDVFQTGSGTSTNMNMNEVLAALASTPTRPVHPNDHVNQCQSSNDVIPSAIQLACALHMRDALIPSLLFLEKELRRKARAFRPIIKTARTHLMDAVPVRLGDEFAAYAALLSHSRQSLEHALRALCILPLGGTAAGTGLNAHPAFAPRTIGLLRKETGLKLREAGDHIAAQSCPLALLACSAALRQVAAALTKMAGDIRLMGSGPVCGLAELQLPPLQAGSSIMPGKVNPVLCESVLQVAMEVTGADATVHAALVIGSQFELNTAMPVAAHTLLRSIRLLANVSRVFAAKCVRGIAADKESLRARSLRNPILVTALAPRIGYDRAAAIAKEALETGESLLAVAQRRTEIPESELRRILAPERML
ncbi:MAG: class II fumarate hydratase [Candidatus Peribacteraceae bacterium]|jgi:fumarate hydratase class II